MSLYKRVLITNHGVIAILSIIAMLSFSSCQTINKIFHKKVPSIEKGKYEKGIFWVRVKDEKMLTNNDGKFTIDLETNQIFKKHKVYAFKQALPFSSNDELLRIYEVKCKGNIHNLIEEMKNKLGDKFYSFSKHEKPIERIVYNPSDYMWQLTLGDPNNWLWHLYKTECNKAWDVTKGCEDIIVAVMDYDIDVSHPDLYSKLSVPYDPYTGIPFTTSPWHAHGTAVSGLAAGETAESGTTAQGQMASAGFSNKLIFYQASVSRQLFLQKALHASKVMGAKVIVSCAGASLNCGPNLSTGEDLIVKEILDHGTSIIVPAGNGLDGYHCGTIGSYQGFYPFHSSYDNRLIIVTSSSKNDTHFYQDGNGNEKTHSHFPDVDICAPGYEVLSSMPSENGSNTWPYYGSLRGTSFSSPLVASISALVLSVNPSIQPMELKDILVSTTDPIADASNYPGLIGSGRINAFKAVKKALKNGTSFVQNTTYTVGGGPYSSNTYIENGNTRIESGYSVTNTIPNGNVIINPNTNVTFQAPYEVVLSPGFEVKNNSLFEIKISNPPCN